jgi:hypothetical protein
MISRIIGKILSHSQETQTLIGVRKNNDEDKCWVGYIVDFNETLFVLQHISPMGLLDGLILEKLENIDNFETDDEYIKTIQILFEQKNKIAKQAIRNIEITEEENWQYEVLKNSFDQGRLISVEINNSDTVNYGYVLDYDDASLQISAISDIGEGAGTQTYRLTDISSLTVDRIEGRKREMLYNLKNQKLNN